MTAQALDKLMAAGPARQAAALLLTNTAAPVHVADVIVAIGRMLKTKLTIPVIASGGVATLDDMKELNTRHQSTHRG